MADYRFPDSLIQVFAKAPISGKVKTRMQPALTEQQSLSLHRKMVSHCLHQACASGLAPVQLWVTAEHEYWSQLGQALDFRLRLQTGADLGERMANAFIEGLATSRSVLLMGTDSPGIDEAYLAEAFTVMATGSCVVLGPALDGGYVLLGLSEFDARVFENVPWGSEQVLASTLQKVSDIGWPCSLLAVRADIDRPDDLEYLKTEFPSLLPASP